jgi:hypothetical protein
MSSSTRTCSARFDEIPHGPLVSVGNRLGKVDGTTLGSLDGSIEGSVDGNKLGSFDGVLLETLIVPVPQLISTVSSVTAVCKRAHPLILLLV